MGHAAQRPEIVWSAARAERERAAAEVANDGLHLTRAQKWDLVRICAAAVASAAFFSAPFLLSRESTSLPEAQVGAAPALPVEQAHLDDRISIVTTNVVVPVNAVGIRRERPVRTPRAVTVRASNEVQAVRPDEAPGLARRLKRAIAGDGRYTVRPFPSLDSNQ
jgi:hypothetical protein